MPGYMCPVQGVQDSALWCKGKGGALLITPSWLLRADGEGDLPHAAPPLPVGAWSQFSVIAGTVRVGKGSLPPHPDTSKNQAGTSPRDPLVLQSWAGGQ